MAIDTRTGAAPSLCQLAACAQASRNAEPAGQLSQEEKKELKRLESQIEKLSKQEAELEAAFAKTDLTPTDFERMGKELNEVRAERERKEERWMELAELAS